MRKAFLLIFLTCVMGLQARERRLFDDSWRFILNPSDTALYQQNVDDSSWRLLNLPHDWAIEGDFSVSNPSGASGGALPGGIGWYRKHFKADVKDGEQLFIDFDGVYMNATVWINGHRLGTRPYGYSSFSYDLTPYLQKDNVIAVKVDDSDQPNSRWYSGCGIYRHVWLTKVNTLHIGQWGNHVVTDGKGNITVKLDLCNLNGVHPAVRNTVYDASGKIVAQQENGSSEQQLKVKKPHLWSPSSPNVYTVKSEVIVDNKTVDEVTTTTGFRDYRFDAKTGFWLNGKNMKLNGVCDHHDLGCLGAALNEDALHRQLLKLKEMGVNAIRCSHNPPAPELLNMCDTMGFIVMDESFDMWRRRKSKNDYARFFDQWHERDLSDMVRRDRNHPSILIWSIGNEVLEQWSSANADELTLEQANLILNAGHDASTLAHGKEMTPNALLTQHLVNIVKDNLSLDGGHNAQPLTFNGQRYYITAGCNEPSPDNHLFKSGALDIIGFNYHHQYAKDVPKNFPGKPFLFTESVSALATRGYYRMPSASVFVMPERWDKPFTDPSMMCSAYDNCRVPWGATHEESWDVVKHTPYCAGQFIWTGWDYIGEPTPYGFPARSSYFGIIDLAGFPKDSYYMYQSEWTDKPVLHLFPHWNWTKGQTIDMWCYYNNADEVELFVNGKSQGVRRKENDHQYHVAWRVQYEPGEVKAVSRKGGKVVKEQVIRTAGPEYTVRLTKDYDGKNTLFVNAEVVDKDGNLCPWAEDDIHFSVTGGTIIGVDNGSQTSMERFKADHRKAFFGKALVVIRKDADAKEVTVTATSPMLKESELRLCN